MPKVATGKNNLGLNISGRRCRKQPAEVGGRSSCLIPASPNPSQSHGLHSHSAGEVPLGSLGQQLASGCTGNRDSQEPLCVLHPQLPAMKALLRVQDCWPGLIPPFCIRKSPDLPPNLCCVFKQCARTCFLTNSMSLLFLRSPILSLLRNEGLEGLEWTHRWSLFSWIDACS